MSEWPRSIHVTYVCCDADYQDAMHQGDKPTVPLITPGAINATQDKVERRPKEQAQECTNHEQRHSPLCSENNKNTVLKPASS